MFESEMEEDKVEESEEEYMRSKRHRKLANKQEGETSLNKRFGAISLV